MPLTKYAKGIAKKRKGTNGIIQIMNQYDTEEKCEEVFFKNKFPDGFICPVCKCKEYYPIKRHIKSKNGSLFRGV